MYKWKQRELEMLYICEYIQMGYEMKFNQPTAMAGGSNLAGKSWDNGNPMKDIQEFRNKFDTNINIIPTFPDFKPVGVGLMAMELKTGKVKYLKHKG
jgi:hypothetical protein